MSEREWFADLTEKEWFHLSRDEHNDTALCGRSIKDFPVRESYLLNSDICGLCKDKGASNV